MQLTLNSDFLDGWAELPGAEYQPLLDFEEEITDEGKFADVNFLTTEIKRGACHFCGEYKYWEPHHDFFAEHQYNRE
ncbi:hypothetical protein [Microcoleus sp. K4-B3]|uniref:hypothetical protein n=1 Tax=Microcoleus sp. K4-B3 TaxID=2818791 RepID=UPI002FD2C150